MLRASIDSLNGLYLLKQMRLLLIPLIYKCSCFSSFGIRLTFLCLLQKSTYINIKYLEITSHFETKIGIITSRI